QIEFFVQEGRIESEVDLDVSVFLINAVLKVSSVNSELHRLRLQAPGGVEPASRFGTPQIPHALKLISMIGMDVLGSKLNRLLGRSAIVKRLFKNRRFVPRDAVYRKITDPRPRRRKRKLPQHRQSPRHHLLLAKTRKPETQIETICHAGIILLVSSRRNELLSCSASELLSSAA